MAKSPNTFQKRQREMDKKRKAEDKRKRRQAAKNAPAHRDESTNDGNGDKPSGDGMATNTPT